MTTSALYKHLDEAARQRERALELVDGIERLLGAFGRLSAPPLDVVERLERALVKAHTANLLVVDAIVQHRPRRPVPDGATGSLHELGCGGPAACSCQPLYVADEVAS